MAVAEDPSDDKFVECALSLNVEYIISGDRALLDLKQYGKTNILSPKEFLDVMGEG